MEFRKIFDTIPDQFDKYRPRYSQELFDSLIEYAQIGKGKNVLELGPGTGQATRCLQRRRKLRYSTSSSIGIFPAALRN